MQEQQEQPIQANDNNTSTPVVIKKKRRLGWRRFFGRWIALPLELLGFAFILVVLALLFVRQPVVQSYMGKKGLAYLSDKLNTRVSADSIYIDLFNGIYFENLYIEDWQCDTLLYAHKAKIDIQRVDVWNQQLNLGEIMLDEPYFRLVTRKGHKSNLSYVLDALKGTPKTKQPNTAAAAADTTGKDKAKGGFSFNPTLTVERVSLSKPRFLMLDEGDKQLSVALQQLDIPIKGIDIRDQCVEFHKILLDKPRVSFVQYYKPDYKPSPESDEIFHISPTGWQFIAEAVQLRDGAFTHIDEPDTLRRKNEINFKNLRLQRIHIDLQNVVYGNDTVLASQAVLSATERSGFVLEQLRCNMLFSATGFELKDLLLKTPHTKFGNYLSMQYRTLRHFDNFVDKVRFKAKFDPQSVFMFSDISYFTDKIAKVDVLKHNIDKPIHISGELSNKIENLKGEDLYVRVGNTQLEGGSLSMKGLPDFRNTFIDVKVKKLKTSIADVRTLLPPDISQKIPPPIDPFGSVTFKGNFIGFPSDFVAYGDFDTDIGRMRTDLKMDLRGQKPVYSGDVAVSDFQVGRLSKQPDIGNLTAAATINGTGFNIDELNADIKGEVDAFAYKNYTYRQIHIDGQVNRRLFTGELAIKDDNINISYFKGTINLNDKIPAYNFKAAIEKLDLKKLHLLTPEQQKKFDWIVAGKTELDLRGNNIDNIEGTAKLNDLSFVRNGQTTRIGHLEAMSFKQPDGMRSLNVASDILNAQAKGNFDFKDLAPAFQNYLNRYFPYRFKPTTAGRGQQIDFEISLHNPANVLQLFLPQVQSLSDAYLKGNFNSITRVMSLQTDVKEFVYDKIGLYNIQLKANSNPHDLQFTAALDSLALPGRTLPQLAATGSVFNDTIDFNLHVAADTAAYRAQLAGLLFANSDTLKLKFDTTEIVINHQKWETNTGTFAYKNKDYFEIEDVLLQQGKQKIALKSQPSRLSKNYTEINLENINLMDFAYIKPIDKLGIETQISGDIVVKDVFDKQMVSAEVSCENFVFRGQKMGDIMVSAFKQKNNNNIDISAKIENNQDYELEADGYIALPDKKGDPTLLNATANITRGNLRFIEAFTSSFTSHTEGKMRGVLSFNGNIEHPAINGKLLVRDGGTTINYLQTHYTFDNAEVEFNNNKLLFKSIELHDRESNSAYLNGWFNLNDFKHLSLDIRMETDKFLFLNTKLSDNNAFYGTAYGGGYMTIKGPVEQLAFYINAQSKYGTRIYIPLSEETAVSQNAIYSFIEKDTLQITGKLANTPTGPTTSGMNVDMDLDITPDAELQLIFDMQAGDIIKAKGKGDIQIKVSTIGDFDYKMYGRYEIEEGSYLFTLRNVINKQFTVQKGGTILFSGDPYNALLDLNAVYRSNAIPKDFLTEAELNSISPTSAGQLSRRVPIDVMLHLAGILSSPDIKFNLQFPRTNNPQIDDLINGKINELSQNDLNELNRQVFGLLIFNRFMPPERLALDVKSGGLTTISELLSNYFSNFLNEMVSGFIPGSEVNVNYRNYDTDATSENASSSRNEFEFVYTQRLFNDRLELQVGNNFDFAGNNDVGNNNTGWSIDVVLRYKITPDGRIKVQLFNKRETDILSQDFNKTGGGIIWSKEFDSLEELFQERKNAGNKPELRP